MTGRAHDARVLADMEAEFREHDPGLLALFDRFGYGRAAVPASLRHWAPAAVLLIALSLTVILTSGAGWQPCPLARTPRRSSRPDRGISDVQRWTSEAAQDVQMQVCRAIPDRQTPCG